jgi:hypothetical protein
MNGLKSAMNPNVVKTALDKVFKQSFEPTMHPGYVDATSPSVFKQDSTDKAAIVTEVFKGTGLWGARTEDQDVAQASARVTNQQTFSVTNFAQSVDISKNFFDDDQHTVYEKMVADMAETGRITRDMNAFAIFRGAFTTTLTNDGATLVSDSHTTISGDTVDNKLTAVLATASLNDAIVALVEQKAQDGTVRGSLPQTLLVPPKLFKTACELTESQYRPGTDYNDINVYSTKYGITVATSPFLGAAAGGSDTAWFLLGNNHSIYRWVRQAVTTDLVDYKYQRNNSYIYKGEFREVVGALDYAGIVGSDGTV